jgi:hypothetical protein
MIQAQSNPTGMPIRSDLALASARGWRPGPAGCALPPIARLLGKPTSDCPVPPMDGHHAGSSQVFPHHARCPNPTIGHADRSRPWGALGIDPCVGKADSDFVGQHHKSRPSRCNLQHPFDRSAPSVATFSRRARLRCSQNRRTSWGPLLFTRRDNLRQIINP